MSAWNHWWFGRYGLEQVLLDDFLKKEGGWKKRKKQLSLRDGQSRRSEDIATLPLFMYLWHVIKPVCLDWEITPCLPTNKPSAVVSNPLFIIHNPLWCQGQSDCIVMVKGKLEEPELSTGTENPGNERTKVEIWRLRASSLTQRARNWHIKKWKCTAKLRLMINSVGFVCLFF